MINRYDLWAAVLFILCVLQGESIWWAVLPYALELIVIFAGYYRLKQKVFFFFFKRSLNNKINRRSENVRKEIYKRFDEKK